MRVVVDTNIFVSAAFKENSWPAISVRWIDVHCRLLTSQSTRQELMEVLRRPKFSGKIAPVFVENLERMFGQAEEIIIERRVTACRDPKDDKFLELALNGAADVIVSGDADLLTMHAFRGIPIVDAASFQRSRVR